MHCAPSSPSPHPSSLLPHPFPSSPSPYPSSLLPHPFPSSPSPYPSSSCPSPPFPSASPSSVFPSSSVSAAPLPSSSSTFFSSTVVGFSSTAVVTDANANLFPSHKNRRGIIPSAAQSQQRLRPFEGPLRANRPAELFDGKQFISVPPVAANATREEQQKKRRNSPSDKNGGGEGMAVTVQQKLFENYHLVAYSLVIVTYLLAFCEYLYLRLLSLIFSEPLIYRRNCEKHHYEIVIRNEVHFASGCAIFLVMSVFQLVCFFLLTLSSRFMQIKRTFSHVVSIEQRLRHELIFSVQRTMFATLYPTFAIYLLCSAVVLCSIFYMVGLRDQILHVGSRVIIYVFDLFVVLYFLAFPLLCVLFHPDIDCCARLVRFCCWRKRRRKAKASGEQPNSVGSKSLRTVTEVTDQMGVNSNDGNCQFVDAIGHSKIAGGTEGIVEIMPKGQRGGSFSLGKGTHSVPAKMETMAKGFDKMGEERGERAAGECFSVPTMQQPMAQSGGSVANYGSLERRRPWGTDLGNNLETKSTALPTGTSVCIRAIRQRRRGDKYRRLRGGSDESAEWRQSTTIDAITKIGTETKTDGGGADKTEERRTKDERRNAERRAVEQMEAWEDAGTVSC